jgi:FAD/FMN-containing dehydrogenase
MPREPVETWGRTIRSQSDCPPCAFLDEAVAELRRGAGSLIAYGLGRSYGDVPLNDGGRVLRMHRCDRLIAADWERGIIRAEAGAMLGDILKVTVPRGWFLPVTPGTKYVTLGGAIANDVHGKNHESAGTFGCHVTRLALARSSGEMLELSPTENADLFAATVGGLGLTGLILWAEVQLTAIRSAYMETETARIDDLDHFFSLAQDSRDWPCSVAWVDCLAGGRELGRGFFIRGRPSPEDGLTVHAGARLGVPVDAPGWLLNAHSLRAFNALYLRRPGVLGRKRLHYDPFYYPLDAIAGWNRLYGRRGFFQHQSAVPMARARETTRRLLELTAAEKQGSFLVVLKLFGNRPSPGILSFPLEGATLALDFPNKGERTRALLARMADVVLEAGGRLYPAKDATMSGSAFRASYPEWRRVEAARDPAIMSDFWKRVTADAA